MPIHNQCNSYFSLNANANANIKFGMRTMLILMHYFCVTFAYFANALALDWALATKLFL